jgi:hypothetical protein
MPFSDSEHLTPYVLPINNQRSSKISENKAFMDKRIKLSIMESDIRRLTALMLWFEQFPEFQVNGMLAESDASSHDKILLDCQILLLSDKALSLHDHALLKLGAGRPALVLLKGSEACVPNIVECDGALDVDASLKDVYDQVEKVAVRRKLMVTPAWLPASKAS